MDMPPCRPGSGRATPRQRDGSGVHLWLVLWKAYASLSRHAASSVERLGLGESDFRVLEALLHKGPLPVNSLGPKVDLTPGSISVAVDRLVRRKLVTRRDDPRDRRVRVVELTECGRALIEAGFARHREHMEQAVQCLSQEDRRTLIDLLKRAGKGADAQSRCRGGTRAPGEA